MDINWTIFFVLLKLEASSTSDLQSVSACYGITFDNFMSIACEAGSVIALKDVKAMAKPKSTECPQEETAQVPAEESCCRYDPADCGATYTGNVASQYYSLCYGKSNCNMLQPTWVDTAISTNCDTDVYIERTNYMIMEYQCISSQSSTGPCSSVSVTDTSVLLWNDNYPARLRPDHNGCSCSVEASCYANIEITAQDVRFTEEDGECKQRIAVTENEITTEIGCETNNNYLARTIYTSTSGFLTLEVLNDLPNNRGNFWLILTAISDKNATLTLSCGEKMQQSNSEPCDDKTSVETTSSSSSSTTSGTITTTTATTSVTTNTLADNTTTAQLDDIANITSSTTDLMDSTPTKITTTTSSFVNASTENETTHAYENSSDTSNNQNTTVTPPSAYTSTYILSNKSYSSTTHSYSSSSPMDYMTDSSDNDVDHSSPSTESDIITITYNYTQGDTSNTDGSVNTSNTTQNPMLDSTIGSGDTVPGTGRSEGEPNMSEGSDKSSSSDNMMTMIVVAVIAILTIIIIIILIWKRRKLKELLCGKQTKSEVDPESERTDSPPQYATLPEFLFSGAGSPVITSSAAGSTQLHIPKLSEGGIIGRKQELSPIALRTKVSKGKRLPPVDTKLHTRTTKSVHKPQKLGFLNMIMVENQQQPFPRFYPDHIEGGIRESYGASTHAVSESEIVEKGRKNVNRKTRLRRKKKKLMERLHRHTGATETSPLSTER